MLRNTALVAIVGLACACSDAGDAMQGEGSPSVSGAGGSSSSGSPPVNGGSSAGGGAGGTGGDSAGVAGTGATATGGSPAAAVPCGSGWGTDPISGSVDLGLASGPEIGGVPDGLAVERAIFDQINEQRALNGISPLVFSEQVSNVARSHAADMNQRDYFDHGSETRPYRDEEGAAIRDNWLPHPRLEFVYPGHFSRAGENIASYPDPEENVVDAWMNSDGHRAAILDEYGWSATHGGLGVDGNIAVFSPAVCAE